jgi:hypothetical protein
MHPPNVFEHNAAAYDYAERNGLTYVWDGTAAFEKRKRLLSPKQYQILAVHTRRGSEAGAAVLEGHSQGRDVAPQCGQARSTVGGVAGENEARGGTASIA